MEFIADVIAGLVVPSSLALLLFVAGVMTRCFSARVRLSWWLLAASCGVTAIFSWGIVAALLMRPLEYRFPTLDDAGVYSEARHIVVLTGWGVDDPSMPLTSRVNPSTAYRLLRVLELVRERPDCSVIVSGSAGTAELMGRILMNLGVPAARLTINGDAWNTAQSAANVSTLIGERPFFLVTSAGHMPRAVGAARREGLTAIAVPADYKVRSGWVGSDFAAEPESLMISNLAIHEYLGYLWYWLTGRIA